MTVFLLILAIAFFSVISVLVEGGRRLGNLSRAEDIAAEVARSAAATLDVSQISQGIGRIDAESGRARSEANKVIDAIPEATIERFDVSPQRVFVVVRVRGTSFIPGLDIDGVGSHAALALDPFEPTP